MDRTFTFELKCHIFVMMLKDQLFFYPPLPGHLVVGIVVTADAEAKELAGGVLDLGALNVEGTLEEPVASLQVPVTPPQEVHTADGQEVSRGQPLQKGLELICR